MLVGGSFLIIVVASGKGRTMLDVWALGPKQPTTKPPSPGREDGNGGTVR